MSSRVPFPRHYTKYFSLIASESIKVLKLGEEKPAPTIPMTMAEDIEVVTNLLASARQTIVLCKMVRNFQGL